MQIVKAERKKSKLRLSIAGVSGSGKSRAALLLAKGLGGSVVVIDTENGSAHLYAKTLGFDYSVCELTPPFSPKRYIEAIESCELAGFDTIIIDSMSHEWAAEGGALEIVTKLAEASTSKNTFTPWGKVTPMHNQFINKILHSKCHIIGTLRSKAEHVLTEVIDKNGRKKSVPEKVGMAVVQREGLDYEFAINLELDNPSHVYRCTKDRTGIFNEETAKITEEHGKKLREWLDSGAEPSLPQETQQPPADNIHPLDAKKLEAIKQKIDGAATVEALTAVYKSYENVYPGLKNNIIEMCSKRKQDILEVTKGVLDQFNQG